MSEQRQNRSCIRPEVSRSQTFGRVGVSKGQFFDSYLKYIKLNDVSADDVIMAVALCPYSQDYVDFTRHDLSGLLKTNYDRPFLEEVYQTAIKVG